MAEEIKDIKEKGLPFPEVGLPDELAEATTEEEEEVPDEEAQHNLDKDFIEGKDDIKEINEKELKDYGL